MDAPLGVGNLHMQKEENKKEKKKKKQKNCSLFEQRRHTVGFVQLMTAVNERAGWRFTDLGDVKQAVSR